MAVKASPLLHSPQKDLPVTTKTPVPLRRTRGKQGEEAWHRVPAIVSVYQLCFRGWGQNGHPERLLCPRKISHECETPGFA